MSQGFSYHCKMVSISQEKVCERVLMVSYLLPWDITSAITPPEKKTLKNEGVTLTFQHEM